MPTPPPSPQPVPLQVAPLLAPPLSYYARVARAPLVAVDCTVPYTKALKASHRMLITHTRGPLLLSVPIVKPRHGQPIQEILVSPHRRWWEGMRLSLESAYGTTAHFDQVYALLQPLLQESAAGAPLVNLTTAVDAALRQLMGIATPHTALLPGLEPTLPPGTLRLTAQTFENQELAPYTQHHMPQAPYVPAASAIDALCTLGPQKTRTLLGL